MLQSSSLPVHDAIRFTAGSVGGGLLSGAGSRVGGHSKSVAWATRILAILCAPRLGATHNLTNFLAGRKNTLGTGLLSRFTPLARVAPPGWWATRPVEIFLAGRRKILGTGLLSQLTPLVRVTLPGWWVTRPVGTPLAGRRQSNGILRASAIPSPTPRSAPGWSAGRESAIFSTTATPEADSFHLSVFPAETLDWMGGEGDGLIVDCTLGAGGHTESFLKSGKRVLGIDRDPQAIAHALARLARYGDRLQTWQGNFADMQEIPALQAGTRVDGILLDLGVSSHQLDSADRGFSFQRKGPLDMRMGPSSRHTAAEIVNTWPEAELVRMFFEEGEEPKARRIAVAIVKQRAAKPFVTTLELADCIEKAIGRHGRIHPATRAFQAIRMNVNEELSSLRSALLAVPKVLKPGGRLLIITFHSLEDRIVKHFLRHHSAPFIDDPGWPAPRANPDCKFRLLARKAITPTAAEIANNPRSRSAKLRVAQLLDPAP